MKTNFSCLAELWLNLGVVAVVVEVRRRRAMTLFSVCMHASLEWNKVLKMLCICFSWQHTHTHTQPFYCSSGICPGPPGWAGTGTRKVKPGRVKPIWIYWSKRKWVAVASAGLYASLHLIPDNHASIPPLKFFTGRMPFLPPNQQHQSTKGNIE